MSDAMSSSDTRRNCAPEAGATEALRPTVSLLLLTVSMVPRQLELDAVCSGRLRNEGRMYYVAKKRVKAHSLSSTLYKMRRGSRDIAAVL